MGMNGFNGGSVSAAAEPGSIAAGSPRAPFIFFPETVSMNLTQLRTARMARNCAMLQRMWGGIGSDAHR